MSGEEKRLCNKIRVFEDMLLRSKNNYEIEESIGISRLDYRKLILFSVPL